MIEQTGKPARSVIQFSSEFSSLNNLALRENVLRSEALEKIASDASAMLHLRIVQAAMDIAFEHFEKGSDDEDTKVTRMLSMRAFNAFGSSIRLHLSGYAQNAAALLRDVMETTFLLDLFRTDRPAIERFRMASIPGSTKAQREEFKPIKVRETLDARDGYTGSGRGRHYKQFSELAAHPTMQADIMMRPEVNGNATLGPFHGTVLFPATLFEMGMMAGLFGETLREFLDDSNPSTAAVAATYEDAHTQWHLAFNPKLQGPSS